MAPNQFPMRLESLDVQIAREHVAQLNGAVPALAATGALRGRPGSSVMLKALKTPASPPGPDRAGASVAFDRAILDSMLAQVVVLNPAGDIIATNEAWRRVAAVSAGGAVTTSLHDAGVGTNYLAACDTEGGPDARRAADGIRLILAGQCPAFKMEHSRRIDGQPRVFALFVTPLAAAGGGAVVTHVDITERKLTDEQLRQAQKMEAIGQLTGGIAHDFNNLLAIIVGNLDLLNATAPLTEGTREFVQTALRACQRGADLTRQLLAFGRRQALLPQPVNLNEAATSIIGLLRRTMPESIAIDCTAGPGDAAALVDPAQLDSTLMNLALNARDAMPSGGRITFSTELVELREPEPAATETVPAGHYAAISISDTGIGIPPDMLPQLFDPLFTTKAPGRGTGLGLSMVHGFVGQSGGYIQVTSTLGRGTSFRLLLPMAPAPAAAMPPVIEAAASAEPARRHILVVDDMPDIGDMLGAILSNLGYEATVLVDGPAALAALSTTPFDGMITDVGLDEGMSGLELAEQAIQRRPDLRIATMSGLLEEGNGAPAAVRMHLQKPVNRATLRRAMEALFTD